MLVYVIFSDIAVAFCSAIVLGVSHLACHLVSLGVVFSLFLIIFVPFFNTFPV